MIVFSHGFGGCATQSRFLAAALADRGYWVFALNHKDARCGRRGGGVKPDEPFREPEKSVSRSLCSWPSGGGDPNENGVRHIGAALSIGARDVATAAAQWTTLTAD
jgi:hypothetical protein